MPNQLSISGASAQKQTRYAILFNSRFSSGLYTNRSPLRDALTSRLSERYYGADGDALIAGLNVEITNKITLARRPGNSVFEITQGVHATGSHPINSVDRFYDFRLSSTNSTSTEAILVMVDQANALYSINTALSNQLNPVWYKSPGAGKTYMQSVGNTLFFGNGVDNKKYLQSMFNGIVGGQWQANQQLGTATTPFLSTYLIDGVTGNLQQLVGTCVPVGYVYVQSDTVEIILPAGYDIAQVNSTPVIAPGDEVTFPSKGMVATFLEGKTVTVTAVGPNYFLFNLVTPDYGQTAESGVYAVSYGDGNPSTGSAQPSWNTATPYAGNYFSGGLTYDGYAVWANRGNPVENWGISMTDSQAIVPSVVGGATSWKNSTFYSPVSVIIDSNGNLQQVTRAGLSGATHPMWNTAYMGQTLDGVSATGTGQGVVWTMIASAAMMSWQANFHYPSGSFLLETASGTPCLFQSSPPSVPYISGDVGAYVFACPHSSGPPGDFGVGTWNGLNPYNGATNPSGMAYPTSAGRSSAQNATLTGFDFSITSGGSGVFEWDTNSNTGNTGGTTNPFPGYNENLFIAITASLVFPAAGQYTFVLTHGDGLVWGMGGGATLVSGSTPQNLTVAGTQTSLNGYPIFNAGSNLNVTANSGNAWIDTYVVNVPSAGSFPVEINLARWDKNHAGLTLTCNGVELTYGAPTGGATSGTTPPTWPAWTRADAPLYPHVTESAGTLQWNNLGPATDFVWAAAQNFTLPDTTVTDSNFNIQAPYESGYTASTGGPPSWATTVNATTADNPDLCWICQGPSTAPVVGTITTSNGGWKYGVSLVNTLDLTVSNSSSISAGTGDFVEATGVYLSPGQGLPPIAKIDSQSDYVAVWRTTDGGNTAFLVPSSTDDYTAPVTLPLSVYLTDGYTDTTLDVDLNNLISAPVLGEGTPPGVGAINLCYYLSRLFYSIDGVVEWTSGPDMPAGNGLNGSNPLNFDQQNVTVKRLVPSTPGLFVFTVSDINLIQGNGTAQTPIQPAVSFLEGVGILSWDALDTQGPLIGYFTTDNQFCVLDPSSGANASQGWAIADQFQMVNGPNPGQNWNPANVYVTHHISGQDQAWYVADGATGWYRMIPTPVPEQGTMTWSPFAPINAGVNKTGSCKAVQSIEVTPGVHRLLIGPTGTGEILYRDITTNADAGIPYPAWAVLGSFVLAQPGQVAVVPFITTESVGVGLPLTLGVLIDEALPYWNGQFDILKHWKNDPPNLRPSISIPSQRFYLSEDEDNAAAMRHMQIKVSWAEENAPNELLSMAIFGGFLQED